MIMYIYPVETIFLQPWLLTRTRTSWAHQYTTKALPDPNAHDHFQTSDPSAVNRIHAGAKSLLQRLHPNHITTSKIPDPSLLPSSVITPAPTPPISQIHDHHSHLRSQIQAPCSRRRQTSHFHGLSTSHSSLWGRTPVSSSMH